MTHEDYMAAADFWLEKDKAATKAPADEILEAAEELITACKTCALATGSGEFVRCTPVDYTYHDGAFWVFTEGGLKFASLEKNKNVSLAVYDPAGTFGKLHSVQVMGRAELIEPFSEEYNANAELRKIPIATLQKLAYTMYLLKIVPDEIILLDSEFKKRGFANRQIWKR